MYFFALIVNIKQLKQILIMHIYYLLHCLLAIIIVINKRFVAINKASKINKIFEEKNKEILEFLIYF